MGKTIYELDLHESLYDENIGSTITRVASGWLYKYEKELYNERQEYYYNEVIQIVFVPYDDIFQEIYQKNTDLEIFAEWRENSLGK